MKSSFYWLLFFCIRTFGENITLSSDYGSIVVEINNASFEVIDQFFWENFEYLFPNYYFSGSTITVHQFTPTHYYYTLAVPYESFPSLAIEEGVYRCPFCSRNSKGRKEMYDHIRLHYGIKVHCSKCGLEYKYKKGFTKHRKKH